ncbi:MAG: lipopolysaccharide biosynthesis protein [Proteiniphilum sp.]|uniref:lipopolysaccharide biosynthesis protein n=1 Tax=Proteiniphilum sp. TaxID=1926877 RepID=UPI002B2093DB|nr:lipopolysaccharide biosynthesis protein [Proteiniphilum sp.]MEA5129360.1 lipopolysaccharide biosynthesis protein [Proteiniphilum sp.]
MLRSESKNLKDKTITGMFWSFIERFGSLSIQFITNIVLARLLTPADFGLIGMIMVFVAISLVMIDGGLGAALIQKKQPTEQDYSTIFFSNIILASIIYVSLYFASSSISSFYHQPELNRLLKVMGLILLVDSFSIVQNNILIKKLYFRKIARIKILAASFSSFLAILCAFFGLGVWSIAVQYLANSLLKTILLWLRTSWTPIKVFSKNSFKELFGFGSKLLTASLLHEIYNNFQSLLIGRFFSAKDLGFYTQAYQMQRIPVNTLAVVVNQVTFPVFSEMQGNVETLRSGVRKSLKSLVFLNFPMMVLLAVTAKPLFILLFTAKWVPSVIYFQILCLGYGMLSIVHRTNINVFKAAGRSDLVLYLEIVKKVLGVLLILRGMQYGIIGMIIGLSINTYLEFFLNGYFVGKIIDYGIKKQFKDLYPAFLLSLAVGIIVYVTFSFSNFPLLLGLLLQVAVFLIIYIAGAILLKFGAVKIYWSIIKEKVFKRKIYSS